MVSHHNDDNNDNDPMLMIMESGRGTHSAAGMTTTTSYQRHTDSSELRRNDDNDAESNTWSFTDFGEVGAFSRDGSPHATDEVFNAASHLAATLLSVLGTALLITKSTEEYQAVWKIVSFSIYGASLVFLFTMSTLHHGITGQCEGFFRMMDYLAIYPLIAGTFTPLCLVYYHDSVIGWTFCSTVWVLSIGGMVLTCLTFHKLPKWLSMTLYITLGWLGACMTSWLVPVLGWDGFALFLLGGVIYTVGGYVYTTEQPNPFPGRFGFHEIWHVAVVLAAACHWFLMYAYVLPWKPS